MHVHEATIIQAIRDGARSVDALAAATRASTGCGTCRFDLLDLIARVTAEGTPPHGDGTMES